MIENIFFDLDNTLWDFRKNSYSALQQLYREANIESIYGVSFETFYPVFSHYNEMLWAQFRDHTIEAKTLKQDRFILAFKDLGIPDPTISDIFIQKYVITLTDYNHLVSHSLEMVEYLKPNYALHILSNGFEEVTHRKINNSALKGHFKTVTSAEEIQKRKPQAEIFQYALDKAQAQKNTSVFVGDDWIADALGARDFGIKSIFFDALNENYSGKDITVIKNLNELKSIL